VRSSRSLQTSKRGLEVSSTGTWARGRLALGLTNALYADVDGFDAPGVSTLGACP
jgi:hypothetical protein